MQSPNVKKSFGQGYTIYAIVPLVIGLHIGWFTLQQRYVPVSERHDHPLVKYCKKFTT